MRGDLLANHSAQDKRNVLGAVVCFGRRAHVLAIAAVDVGDTIQQIILHKFRVASAFLPKKSLTASCSFSHTFLGDDG